MIGFGEITNLIKENVELKNKIASLEAQLSSPSKKKQQKKVTTKPSWIVTPEYIGYATATLLMALRDNNSVNLPVILPSYRQTNEGVLLTEIDREKAIKLYCEINNLIIKDGAYVSLDNLLYDIVMQDDKFRSLVGAMNGIGDNMIYYIDSGKGKSYAKKIASAMRRLDNA